jgi:spermidine/putrescine transport system ATP-binding protein
MNFIEGKLLKKTESSLEVSAGPLGEVKIKPDQMPRDLDIGEVTIGIRPEMLTVLFDKKDKAEFEVEGMVTGSAYYGDMTYYTIKIDALDKDVMVSMRNTAGRKVLAPGAKARLGWGAESLLVLE